MPRTEIVPVDGVLLRWARKSAGMPLTEAAKKVGIKESVLDEWESGTGKPTARQLEKCADTYKRPVAVFFLPAPPEEPPLPIDFRTRSLAIHRPVSTKTVFAVRRARLLQEVFADLAPSRSELRLREIPGLDTPPEELARRCRIVLGVTIDEQLTWKNEGTALRAWRSAVETLGVLVFQFPMPIGDTSGFSLGGEVPVVVLNRSDAPTARIFTLFHETGHLILGKPGMCLPSGGVSMRQDDRVERFCNAFAGYLMVPREALLAEPTTGDLLSRRIHLMEAIGALARRFSVSRHMVLRRLTTEHVISVLQHNQAYKLLPKGPPPKKKRKGGGESAPVRAVRELGSSFVAAVCEALDRGSLAYSEASSYLAVGMNHLDRVHEQIPAG